MWKTIEDYPIYEVSNEGQVRNKKTGHIKQHYIDNRGYHNVHLMIEGTRKVQLKRIHRFVAQAFIPNPDNKETVNHKNGDKSNNSVDNLEWMTALENIYHAHEIGIASINMKPVVQYDKKGNYINTFISTNEAARFVGGSNGHISKCCQGKRKTHKGFIWRYENAD